MVKRIAIIIGTGLYWAIGFVFWTFAAVAAFIAGMIISSKGKN